ncbi:MAG: family 20 glycosylhydrolase, partial [Bacteroidota bacterium]
ELMKREGMNDVHELQGYFLGRIHKFLESNGKTMIGWDEIMDAELPHDVMIQVWRDSEYGIEAAREGHSVRLSPTSHCYFDYPLSATDTKDVIEYQPFARFDDLAKSNVVGLECNLWSEHIPTAEVLHQQAYPRMFAMADVMWNGASARKYDSMDAFKAACEFHNRRIRSLGMTPGWAQEPIQWEVKNSENGKVINISSPEQEIELNAKWNNQGAVSTGTQLIVPLSQSGDLEVSALSESYGEFNQTISLAQHHAWDVPVTYDNPYSEWYTAGGPGGLVDGVRASLDFRDGHWQGFWGDDCVVELELETEQTISSVQSQFYQYVNAWILIPTTVLIEVSTDGNNWTEFGTWTPPLEPKLRGKHIQEMRVESSAVNAKFVRLTATNFGVLPDWHEAAGSDVWIFIDEIEVR